MVGKRDSRKGGHTSSNPEKVICWEGLPQFPEWVYTHQRPKEKDTERENMFLNLKSQGLTLT